MSMLYSVTYTEITEWSYEECIIKQAIRNFVVELRFDIFLFLDMDY